MPAVGTMIGLRQGHGATAPLIWRMASWKDRPSTRMKKSIALPARSRSGQRSGIGRIYSLFRSCMSVKRSAFQLRVVERSRTNCISCFTEC